MLSLPRRRSLLALAIVAGATAPASASAIEVGMQDDPAIVDGYNNPDLVLMQFKEMGGTHVRINVDHAFATATSGGRTLATYDTAIGRIRDAGLTPQVTLVWRGEKSPKKWATWTRSVVSHFGTKVNRYSINNEPDLYMPNAKKCTKSVQRSLKRLFPKDVVKFRGKLRGKVFTEGKPAPLIDACNRYQRGVAYGKTVNPVAKAIRSENARAQILGGETSPNKSLEWFFKGFNVKKLKVDAWAHHPFQFKDLTPNKPSNQYGLGNYKLFKKKLVKGLPVYATEFGYPHPGTDMDRMITGGDIQFDEIAKALTIGWRTAKAKGLKQMTQYEWFQKPDFLGGYWDTSLNSSPDAAVSPGYTALKKLISNW